MGLILLVVMFVAMWAVVILPQQRRMRAQQALVAALEEGDDVMTTSGILGTITAIDDEMIHLEIAPGITIRIVRAAIARRMNEPEPVAEPDDIAEDAGEETAVETDN